MLKYTELAALLHGASAVVSNPDLPSPKLAVLLRAGWGEDRSGNWKETTMYQRMEIPGGGT